MMILDANIWIAYLNKNDTQHKKAADLFELIKPPFGLPEYILAETASILAFKAGRNAAIGFLNLTSGNRDIQIIFSDPEFLADVVVLFELMPFEDLSFQDTALLHLSRYHKVVTFDKKLARAIHDQGVPASAESGPPKKKLRIASKM